MKSIICGFFFLYWDFFDQLVFRLKVLIPSFVNTQNKHIAGVTCPTGLYSDWTFVEITVMFFKKRRGAGSSFVWFLQTKRIAITHHPHLV